MFFSRRLLTSCLLLSCAVVSPGEEAGTPPAPENPFGPDTETTAPAAYVRPQPATPLFDPAALTDNDRNALLLDLVLIGRNFQADPAVSPALRGQALAIALTLEPDNRNAVVANGQLARRVPPAELPGTVILTDITTRLHLRATALAAENGVDAQALAACLFAVTSGLDSSRRPPEGFTVVADWKHAFDKSFPDRPSPPARLVPAPRLLTDTLGVVYQPAPPAVDPHSRRSVLVRETFPPPRVSILVSRALAVSGKQAEKPLTISVMEKSGPEQTSILAWAHSRHPAWPAGWTLEFPAQGAATGLAALCVLEAHLTGDASDPGSAIAVRWKDGTHVRPTLPLAAVLRIPVDSLPGRLIVCPDENEMPDWLLLHPPDRTLLAHTAILRARTPSDAIALTRLKPARAIQRGLDAWSKAAVLLRSGTVSLADPRVQAALDEACQWAPANLSAVWLQRMARGALPTRLSRPGTLDRLEQVGAAVISKDRARYPFRPQPSNLTLTPFAQAWKGLTEGKTLDHPDATRYRDTLLELARLMDRRSTSPPSDATGVARSESDLGTAHSRMQAARATFLRAFEANESRW